MKDGRGALRLGCVQGVCGVRAMRERAVARERLAANEATGAAPLQPVYCHNYCAPRPRAP